MSDDNKIYKPAFFNFDVSVNQSNSVNTNAVFSSQDTGGTAQLIFDVDKENTDLPLSSATSAKMAMQMADGSRYVVNPSIFDALKGRLAYSLTDEQLTHSGTVQAELYITYPAQGVQIHRFNFTIDKALIDSDIAPIITYYVQTWDEWEAYFQSRMDELDQELSGLDARADSIQTQFDSFAPAQFAQQSDFSAHVTNLDIHVTAEDKTNWDAKETPESAQAKADQALADAKADSEAKANQALVDANIYTDNSSKETLVWSGSSYFLDTHIFSWDATKVKHGVLLEFSRYIPGTGVQDYGYIQYFFSKEYLVRNNNKATWVNMPGATDAAKKTIRLTPTSVSGDATNGQAPSTSYALRTISYF
ncbi:BppU family phage baseplate upper protein [Listeria ivanovii]|uniref:BppU family phage baseplate upper protein n=1 Tax=Listeria ivanovii TaxID=1638 RepID=UPI001942119E|nr:phage baseplate upper protein [Listeria ivanovii]